MATAAGAHPLARGDAPGLVDEVGAALSGRGPFAVITGEAGAALRTMPAGAFACCVTSPPYFQMRHGGTTGEIGVEDVHDCLGWATGRSCGECYVCRLIGVLIEVWRVLRTDGTLWLNLGDGYAGAGKWGGRPASTGIRRGPAACLGS